MLRDYSGDLDVLGIARTALGDDPDPDDSALSCLLTRLGGAAASSAEPGDAAAHTATSARCHRAAVTAWQRRSPRTLSKKKANIQHFNGISVRISIKLTHQKSHRRRSPAARSTDLCSQMVGRRREGQLRNVWFSPRAHAFSPLCTYIHSFLACFSL